MPVRLLYPVVGEPVRFQSGERAAVQGVECVEDGRLVRANVIRADGQALMAVPIVWEPATAEWAEVIEPHAQASDRG